MSGATTHVLDLSKGRPAGEVAFRLFRKDGSALEPCSHGRTDGDGRAALLPAGDLRAAGYRLEFDVGPYFRATDASIGAPAFLETVVIEFNVAEASSSVHVPLLVSPFGYSTYRGS